MAELYESHFDQLTRYFAVRTDDPWQAEDLASHVFYRALCALQADPCKARSLARAQVARERWLFVIARNLVIDHIRRKSRRPREVALDEALPCRDGQELEHLWEQGEQLVEVRQALKQLTERQRRVVVLLFDAELTASEVGYLMGNTPGAVREMKSAALKKLRALLRAS